MKVPRASYIMNAEKEEKEETMQILGEEGIMVFRLFMAALLGGLIGL